jgi:hypothetical protein
MIERFLRFDEVNVNIHSAITPTGRNWLVRADHIYAIESVMGGSLVLFGHASPCYGVRTALKPEAVLAMIEKASR